MGLKFQKFFGWVLIIGGIAIIFWSLYSSYNIFTNKAAVPEIFKIEEKETVSPKKVQGLEASLEEKARQIIAEQFREIIPADSFVKFFNLIAWSIFAGILIFGGAQISHIGIKMIR